MRQVQPQSRRGSAEWQSGAQGMETATSLVILFKIDKIMYNILVVGDLPCNNYKFSGSVLPLNFKH